MSGPILHVDMDAFFAAVEQRDRPELRGLPVIVGALPGHRGVVSTCSYEARRFGVHSAQPINEAYRLCPQGMFLAPDFARYKAASEHLARILDGISPCVEMASVDEAYLDLAGLSRLFGTPATIGRLLKARIKEELQLTASVGIGPNRLIAKMASDYQKPDGLTVIEPEQVLAFLAPLPIGKLRGVGQSTEEALRRLGVTSIGQLRALERSTLTARFGAAQGLSLYRRARGEGSDEVGREQARKSISEETTFELDCCDETLLRQVLRHLAAGVGRQARAHGMKGWVVTLKLRFSDFETHGRRSTLSSPTHNDDEIAACAIKLFEASMIAGRAVRLIGCGLARLEADSSRQLDLFAPNDAKKRRMYEALDSIQARFGRSALRLADNRGRGGAVIEAGPAPRPKRRRSPSEQDK